MISDIKNHNVVKPSGEINRLPYHGVFTNCNNLIEHRLKYALMAGNEVAEVKINSLRQQILEHIGHNNTLSTEELTFFQMNRAFIPQVLKGLNFTQQEEVKKYLAANNISITQSANQERV